MIKTYEITYSPNLELTQKAINIYEPWDAINVTGEYFYVTIPNHNREYTKKAYVNAASKETAKAMFAVSISNMYLGKPIENGIEPLIFDALRNIVSIEEVKRNE